MRKTTCLIIAGLVTVLSVHANMAMPKQPPAPSGDVLAALPGLAGLRIEREDLRLDLTGLPDARSRARYEIVNPAGTALATDLYFITPFLKDAVVTIDGLTVPLTKRLLKREQVPWNTGDGDYRWWVPGLEIEAYLFRAEFAAARSTVIEVSFRLPAGYDNTLANTGIDPATAAHALNWSKEGEHVAWYVYALETAATFKGGIGVFHTEIVAPAGTELVCNLATGVKKTENGLDTYTAEFQGFPVPAIEARVISRASYNILGGTVAFGFTSDFGSYTSFLSQALIDVFFLNHQFSTGLEGNPFGPLAGMKIPVLYTFIFGNKTSRYMAYFADLRLSGGLLFDLLPTAAFGFRLAAGLRFTLFLLELSYDFYPFDTTRGYVGRITLLGKMSI
jgi:hypothetical protein